MKDPVLAIVTLLKADTAVAATVSTRIYRALLPSSYKIADGPAIVVIRVDKNRPNTTHTTRIREVRVQCTTLAGTDEEADTISDLIADALLKINDLTLSPGVRVIRIDDRGARPDNSDAREIFVYRDHHDFLISYI
jgi:hypothetical protein